MSDTTARPGLATIWVAATLGTRAAWRKLPKKVVTGLNVPLACDMIARPDEPMTLRVSATLLVGVSRIYGHQFILYSNEVCHVDQRLRYLLTSGRANEDNTLLLGKNEDVRLDPYHLTIQEHVDIEDLLPGKGPALYMEAGTPAMLLAAASPMTLAAAAGLESELDLSAMQVEQARAVAAGPEGVRGLITPLGGYLPSGMASTPSAPGGPLDFSRRLTTSSLGGWSPSAGEATLTGFEPQRLPSDLYVPPGEEEGLPMFDLGLGLDLPFPEPPEPMPEPAPEMPWTGGPEERIHGPPTAMGAEPEMGAVSYEPTAAELGLQELEHEPPRKRARPAAARTSISRARAAEAASILILPAALYTDPDVVTASLVTPTHLGVPAARHAEFQAARMEWLARPAPAIEDMDSRIARRFVVRPQSTLLRVPQFEAPSPIRPGFAPVASDSSLLTAGMPYDRDIEEARAYYGEREAGEPLHFAEPGEPMPFTGMGPGAEEEPRARFPWELSRPVSETGLYELERDLQRAQLDTQRGVSMSPLPLPEIPPLDLSLGGQFREISEPPSELAVEAEIPTVETEDDHFQVYLESVMADREEEQVTLSTLVAQAGGTRSAAAQAFYHVLSLASRKRLKVAQDVPYGEIHVRL